uniref:Uncharacterized protein n=1 Tax=Arundo donax TaxID=35708 RepID=A0A0A9B982_ARUDO
MDMWSHKKGSGPK